MVARNGEAIITQLKDFFNKQAKLPQIAHELCHYVPAYLLGFNPTFSHNRVSGEHPNPSKLAILIVTLAPSFVGLLLIIYPAYVALQLWWPLNLLMWFAIAGFELSWQSQCKYDFMQAYQLLKGDWPFDDQSP